MVNSVKKQRARRILLNDLSEEPLLVRMRNKNKCQKFRKLNSRQKVNKTLVRSGYFFLRSTMVVSASKKNGRML